MSMTPTTGLIEFLDSWELKDRAGAEAIRNWPEAQLDTFLKNAQSVLEKCTEDVLRHMRSDNGRIVLYPEQLCQQNESLRLRCLLYADSVLAPLSLPSPGVYEVPARREQTILRLGEVWRVLPFLRTGVFMPVLQGFHGPDDATLDALTAQLADSAEIEPIIQGKVSVGTRSQTLPTSGPNGAVGQARLEQLIARFDGAIVTRTKCSDVPPLHTATIPLIPRGEKFHLPTESELGEGSDIVELARSAITARLSGIISDWRLASSSFQANLVTKSDICWEILKVIERDFSGALKKSSDRLATSIDLPFLDNLAPEEILAERERFKDGFEAFRAGLATYSEAARKAADAGATAADFDLLRDKHLNEPVREINSKLREVRAQERTMMGIATVAVATATFAVYGGQPIAPAILTGLSTLGIGPKLVELSKERAEIERSPMHFLWRLKGRAES